MLEIYEEFNPYALRLVKEINYKDSVDIIQLKWELLTYFISPWPDFLHSLGTKSMNSLFANSPDRLMYSRRN